MISPSTSRLALLASLAWLSACGPSTAPARTVVIPPVTAARPADPTPDDTTEALVWTLDDKEVPTTRWIGPAHGSHVERGAVEGVLIAVDNDVWRWSAKEVHVETVPCEGTNAPPGEGKGLRGTVERLGSTDHFEVIAPATEGGANELQQDVAFEGSIGPYLFLRESTYTFSCGAHGGSSSALKVWDLKSHRAVDMLSPAEVAALDKAERVEAQKQLPAFEDPLKLDDVTFRGALPRFNERGTLRFDDAFSTFACYACTTGSWGSYTTSVDITAHQLPERARAYAKTPAAVVSWISAHPKVQVGGWSELKPAAAPALSPVMTSGTKPAGK